MTSEIWFRPNTNGGLCECGCGTPTPTARVTRRKKGHKAGEPVRYVVGHSTRGRTINRPSKMRLVDTDGYVRIYMPGHPNSCGGYVGEHVLVAARALGKPLPNGAHVHHVNENPSDNRPQNLVICQDNAYHRLIHHRQWAHRECGNANWFRCAYCKQWSDPADLYVKPGTRSGYHRACRNKYMDQTRGQERRKRRKRAAHERVQVDFRRERQVCAFCDPDSLEVAA